MSSLRGPTIFGKRARRASITSEVSSTESVVWVINDSRASFFTSSFSTSSGDSTRYIPPCGLLYCPMVPSTSGWPAWPIRIDSSPRRLARATSIWTLVTSGQVASNTVRSRLFASLRTACDTPWAEKIRIAPSGTSLICSIKMAPRLRRLSTT